MANVTLSGFPEVIAIDVFQGSGASPGKVVVDTLVAGSEEITSVPRTATLTISDREVTGTWEQLKVVKLPRVYAGNMRTVLADSRWKLAEVTLGQNYNDRDCAGVLFAGTQKSITELVAIIAAASGLSITTGSLPSFHPLMAWRGKAADKALDELLASTGCRMVYNPVTLDYVVSKASSGTIASICTDESRFRPGPDVPVRNLIVKTAPVTTEARLAATAVVFSDDWLIETVADPNKIFDNWASYAAPLRSRYQQAAFRLWQVDTSGKSLLGRRALTLMPGDDEPTYAGCRFIKPTLADVPMYVPMIQPSQQASNPLSLTAGGKLFQCEHPYIQVAGAAIQTTATILCAYNTVASGVLVRDSTSISINPSATGDLTNFVEWIKPVTSSESDVDGSAWAALLTLVATALADRYSQSPQHVTVGTLVDHGAIGQIGAVRYRLSVGMSADITTAIAFNFEPADSRGL